MKHVLFLVGLFMVPFCSCNKKDGLVETFHGNLPIVSTNTPATVAAGQDIICKVRCELSSISGSVIFEGFDVTTPTNRQFNVRAKAFYQNWNTQISMPVMMVLDTSLIITTAITGQYVVNFYNAAQLVKSDTVQVN